ncbi:MAG: hypothetical protein JNN13_20530 [Planctomycetes bacterium]|nr:hypothetical protein [Planctomycetota bacterium]
MSRHLLLPITLLAAAPLAAQDEGPRFRIGLAFGGGTFDYETDGSLLDGDTSGGLFRLEFEGHGESGLGGGLRLEGVASDDDLFTNAGFTPREARESSLFGFFSWRHTQHRFAMPVRLGLLFDGLVLEDKPTGEETTFDSVGPYFEIEPQVTLSHGDGVDWSLYGQLGFGAGFSTTEIEGDPREFESSTGFFGLEFGTRLQIASVELGLAYVGRFRSYEESDIEGGDFIFANDSSFSGLLFSFAVIF